MVLIEKRILIYRSIVRLMETDEFIGVRDPLENQLFSDSQPRSRRVAFSIVKIFNEEFRVRQNQ